MVVNLEGSTSKRATLTGNAFAIYSPQPVTFDLDVNRRCRVVVSNGRTGRSFAEERYCVGYTSGGVTRYTCEFDISRLLQLVGDVDGVLSRLDYTGTPAGTAEDVTLQLQTAAEGDVWTTGATVYASAIYASCDWGETIGAQTEKRRVFVDWPQTFRASEDEDGNVTVAGASTHTLEFSGDGGASVEIDVLEVLRRSGDAQYAQHVAGLSPSAVVSFSLEFENGTGTTDETTKEYETSDVLTGRDAPGAVYLRWLHRDGSVGYWLFRKSKESHTTTAGQSFARSLSGNPAAPVSGVIRNAACQDFNAAEVWTIGTANVNAEEFAFLCGLVSSPCVEMYVKNGRYYPVWVRVNVAPGSYVREFPKSGQDRLKDFELSILLPERNALKL